MLLTKILHRQVTYHSKHRCHLTVHGLWPSNLPSLTFSHFQIPRCDKQLMKKNWLLIDNWDVHIIKTTPIAAGLPSSLASTSFPVAATRASTNTSCLPSDGGVLVRELTHPASRGWESRASAASCSAQTASSCVFRAEHILERAHKNESLQEERILATN